ncbi:MAG: hypothetical protein KGJ62_07080 [Armatimonadetes bacterium]|nr:hypothetical protein [Armatimonadota bacterium]MDE2207303.1 hypothetical protein [Armatimonadota bacterium]
MDTHYKLTRLVRTNSSEIHLIWDGEKRVGQVDVHFALDTIHATVIFEVDFSVDDEQLLLAQIDDDIVSSYLARFDREDFVAHVFRAAQISRYTDCSGASEDIEDDDAEREE